VVPSTVEVQDAGVAGPFVLPGEVEPPADAGWRGQMKLPIELAVVFGESKDHEEDLEALVISGVDLWVIDAALGWYSCDSNTAMLCHLLTDSTLVGCKAE